MYKLNIWQRLGIIASVLWIVGGGLWQRLSDVAMYNASAQYAVNECLITQREAGLPRDLQFCSDKEAPWREHALSGSLENSAFVAIAPVVLVWLAAYLLLWLTRWVLAGRNISN